MLVPIFVTSCIIVISGEVKENQKALDSKADLALAALLQTDYHSQSGEYTADSAALPGLADGVNISLSPDKQSYSMTTDLIGKGTATIKGDTDGVETICSGPSQVCKDNTFSLLDITDRINNRAEGLENTIVIPGDEAGQTDVKCGAIREPYFIQVEDGFEVIREFC